MENLAALLNLVTLHFLEMHRHGNIAMACSMAKLRTTVVMHTLQQLRTTIASVDIISGRFGLTLDLPNLYKHPTDLGEFTVALCTFFSILWKMNM